MGQCMGQCMGQSIGQSMGQSIGQGMCRHSMCGKLLFLALRSSDAAD
jgi:hypothetical protein